MITKNAKKKAVSTAQMHETDTGSAEAQIAILTKRIEELAAHLKTHQKDIHSRRGLLQLVSKRQKHMKYLQENKPKSYEALAKKLNLKQKK